MGTLTEFEAYLREGLKQLYSPTYHPPELIWTVTGCNLQDGVEAVQAMIIQAIEALEPGPDVPPDAHVRRLYEVLYYRFIQGLTQRETAQRLGITARHLRREQQQAVHTLAQRLWEQQAAPQPIRTPPKPTSGTTWQSQVRHELSSLQYSAPGTVANVSEALHSAVKSGQALASKHKVSLKVEEAQPDLMATIHPSIFREVLIAAIEKLVQYMSSGEIMLRAEQGEGSVKIAITGYPVMVERPPHSDFIREALTTGSSVSVRKEDEAVEFLVTLPIANRVTVCVVEDNADLVRFYQHYTTRTRYQIVHVAEEENIFEIIVDLKPGIVVLDIMLPHLDGWELLAQLHNHPLTRSIPVIVCSVVRREKLALAHGAALYLQKPVRRQEFIQALDRVLAQDSTTTPKT